jgi:hypothetical protein
MRAIELRREHLAGTNKGILREMPRSAYDTSNQEKRFKQRLNSGKLSDPFFLQDLKSLLALPDVRSMTAQPPSSQQHRARRPGR